MTVPSVRSSFLPFSVLQLLRFIKDPSKCSMFENRFFLLFCCDPQRWLTVCEAAGASSAGTIFPHPLGRKHQPHRHHLEQSNFLRFADDVLAQFVEFELPDAPKCRWLRIQVRRRNLIAAKRVTMDPLIKVSRRAHVFNTWYSSPGDAKKAWLFRLFVRSRAIPSSMLTVHRLLLFVVL